MTHLTSPHPKVIAVVVTYNRLALLQRVVECLRLQTRALDAIVVVNNSSTDGTHSWLEDQKGLEVVTQPNVGGSGGFATGIRQALQMGADWIWCMDDDVFPRPTCLQALLAHTTLDQAGILAPRRYVEGEVYSNDFLNYNLVHPLSSMYRGKSCTRTAHQPMRIAGTAFEGLCVSRQAVERIGLPNAALFIFCDDTDYCLRAHLAGFAIWYVPAAQMDKQQFFSTHTWAERQRMKKWKRFYQLRNAAYLNHHYGRTWGVRYLRSLVGLLGYLLTPGYSWADRRRFVQMYRHGVSERLGKL